MNKTALSIFVILTASCGISTKNTDKEVKTIVEKVCPVQKPCPIQKPLPAQKTCPLQETKIIEKKITVKKECEERFFTLSDGENNYRIKGCKHKIEMINNSKQLVEMIKILVIDP